MVTVGYHGFFSGSRKKTPYEVPDFVVPDYSVKKLCTCGASDDAVMKYVSEHSIRLHPAQEHLIKVRGQSEGVFKGRRHKIFAPW